MIEKEAYATLWALQRFRHWHFRFKVALYSDYNPIIYLTDTTALESSKLMRKALAQQEFVVVFIYQWKKQ